MGHRTTKGKGFTLIEVLLVILILGMLATVGVVMLRGTRESSKIDTTQLKIEKVMNQLAVYELTFGFPTEEQGLTALVTKPEFENEALAKRWRAPYLNKEDLKDAWDRDLIYRLVQDEETNLKKARVYSVGPNGEDESGEGDDIKNKVWAAEAVES